MADNDMQEFPDDEDFEINHEVESEKQKTNDDDDSDMFRKVASLKNKSEDDFGEKVQKRINKLHSEKMQEKERAENESKRARELEERAKLLESELKSFKEKNLEIEESEINRKIADLKAQKRKHLDIADDDYDVDTSIDKVIEIDDEILELKLKARESKNKKSSFEDADESKTVKTEPVNQQETKQEVVVSNAQQEWQDKNEWVFNTRKNSEKIAKANEEFSKLLSEGYDLDDADTFAELDKRLGNDAKTVDKQQPNKAKEKPPTISGVDRGSESSAGKGKDTLTDKDIGTMRKWGLNPNDASVRAEYLKNKNGG